MNFIKKSIKLHVIILACAEQMHDILFNTVKINCVTYYDIKYLYLYSIKIKK